MMRKILSLALGTILLAAASLSAGELSRKSSVAVVLYDGQEGYRASGSARWNASGGVSGYQSGMSLRGAETAAAVIRGELIGAGFKVVNEKTLAEIRRQKAARLALEDNVEAIRKLSRQYGIGQYVSGTVSVHGAERNDFGMYTGTAAIAFSVHTGGGRYLLSDTADAKELGATADEAAAKAVRSAAEKAARRLCGGGDDALPDGGCHVSVSGLRSYRGLQSIIGACRGVYGVREVAAGDYVQGSALLTVSGSFRMEELRRALEDKVSHAQVTSRGGMLYVQCW